MPAELAVTVEEPENPNLPSRSSLAKDLVPLERRAGVAQRPSCITAGSAFPRDALRTSTLA
jgi:hypothetical protein